MTSALSTVHAQLQPNTPRQQRDQFGGARRGKTTPRSNAGSFAPLTEPRTPASGAPLSEASRESGDVERQCLYVAR
ncbi:hypothetical protein [Brooklawnia sp.]|uniref:hypothetical protein n=1 Tax=Brooklawnia sp. TaxID=2699740 RepID=UPI00311F3676